MIHIVLICLFSYDTLRIALSVLMVLFKTKEVIDMFGSKKKDPKFKFELGSKVTDSITGFTGIVVCRTQWIHNCNVYGVQPQELKDGKPLDRGYFDEPQLKLIKEKVVKESRRTGGPEKAVAQANR